MKNSCRSAVVILLLFDVVLTLGLVLIVAVPLAIILGLIAKLALPKTPEGKCSAPPVTTLSISVQSQLILQERRYSGHAGTHTLCLHRTCHHTRPWTAVEIELRRSDTINYGTYTVKLLTTAPEAFLTVTV